MATDPATVSLILLLIDRLFALLEKLLSGGDLTPEQRTEVMARVEQAGALLENTP